MFRVEWHLLGSGERKEQMTGRREEVTVTES